MKIPLRLFGLSGALIFMTGSLYSEAPTLEQTEKNWARNCALCHGKSGDGKTRVGRKLNVRDYTDPAVQETFTRERMTKAIEEGVKNDSGDEVMEGYADKFSAEEIAALVDYIFAMKKEE